MRCDHSVDGQVEATLDRIVRDAGFIDILANSVCGG